MYISEVAPAGMRGRLVSVNQLTIVSGVLLAQTTNWLLGSGFHETAGLSDLARATLLHDSWYGTTCWRWMFGLTAVPAALFFLGMFFVPESPRWLLKRRREKRACEILRRIGGDDYATAAVAEIESTLANETERVNFRELLDPRMKTVLILGVVLAVFQQWCGINVIFNYAEEIFKDAGYAISGALANIVATGAVSMMFTIGALGVVDRGGRRPLMLTGAASLAVIYVVLGIGYANSLQGWPMLALVLAAIGAYSMSLAPITWVILSEIFPNRIRGAAMAVSVSSLWIACFALTITFPVLQKLLKTSGAFWLYAAICAAGFLFIFWKLPETKGKTLEEIEKELVD
jgi:sugar porter (SP) family MFS transporter